MHLLLGDEPIRQTQYVVRVIALAPFCQADSHSIDYLACTHMIPTVFRPVYRRLNISYYNRSRKTTPASALIFFAFPFTRLSRKILARIQFLDFHISAHSEPAPNCYDTRLLSV